MQTHEELVLIRAALERAGWVRLNGGGAIWSRGHYQLGTAYAHREATLVLWRNHGERARYRGEHPRAWVRGWLTSSSPRPLKDFWVELHQPADKLADIG